VQLLAKSVLTETAWGYYRSAGDDEYTLHENAAAFRRFWFRPRVCVPSLWPLRRRSALKNVT
jgi:L-lactate dehydrogenase (cytochrome)